MATTKSYIIPLRKSFQEAAPLKRVPRAIRAIKSYIRKHCKVADVKLGAKLNDAVWARGITHPPHKVKVTAVIDDDVAKVELEGHSYVEAKKVEKKKQPETLKEKIADKLGAKEASKEAPVSEGSQEESKEAPAEKPAPKKADVTSPEKADAKKE